MKEQILLYVAQAGAVLLICVIVKSVVRYYRRRIK